MVLYTNFKSAVYVDGHLTKDFEVITRLLRGGGSLGPLFAHRYQRFHNEAMRGRPRLYQSAQKI